MLPQGASSLTQSLTVHAEDHYVLEALRAAGVKLHLASGTDEGDLLAPGGGLPMVRHAQGDGDGERVRVIVVEEKKEEGAKK